MNETLLRALPLLLLVACDGEPDLQVIDEPMLPEAEAVAEEVMDVAEREAEAEEAADDSAATELPARVRPAVSVVAVLDVDCRPSAVFFETDSAELTDAAEAVLDRTAACLKGTGEDEAVTVRGRTDPRAAEDYNDALARQRATAVVSYLQLQDVDESSFEIVAVGEDGAVEGMPKLYPTQRNAIVRPESES